MSDLSKVADAAAKRPTVRDLIEQQRPAIDRQLAGQMDTDAFVRAVVSEVAKTPKLGQASPRTLLGAVMLAAQLKLEIGSGLGEFYLTPRKSGGETVCLPIIGFQGMIKLAMRSQMVTRVQAFLVREGDAFTYGADADRGMFYEWRPLDFDEDREWVGAVATATMVGGGQTWVYVTRAQIEGKHRPSFWQKTPWETHPEEMARKTAVRVLAKYLPKATEMGRALEADQHKAVAVPGLDEPDVQPVDEHEVIVIEPSGDAS